MITFSIQRNDLKVEFHQLTNMVLYTKGAKCWNDSCITDWMRNEYVMVLFTNNEFYTALYEGEELALGGVWEPANVLG